MANREERISKLESELVSLEGHVPNGIEGAIVEVQNRVQKALNEFQAEGGDWVEIKEVDLARKIFQTFTRGWTAESLKTSSGNGLNPLVYNQWKEALRRLIDVSIPNDERGFILASLTATLQERLGIKMGSILAQSVASSTQNGPRRAKYRRQGYAS